MKKVTLLAFALAAGGAYANNADTGVYIQGDIGLAHLNVDTGEKFRLRDTYRNVKDAYKESGVMPRVSVGYDFGDFRVAGDYTHYKNISDTVKEGNVEVNVKAKAKGVGASVIYDIPLDSAIKPYVGARLAANKVKYEVSATSPNSSASAHESKTRFGAGVMVGAGYEINPQTTIDAGYRYNHIDSDVNAHEVSVGVRYTFK